MSAAGNVLFVVFALTQALSVATVTLVSHAAGRKDRDEANHVFNQSVSMAIALAVATLIGGNLVARPYMDLLGADVATGGEFALIAVFVGACYWIIRDFGAAAQAGFGIGSRLMQAIFLPAMAIAFAAPALAGQNYGARRFGRVRETFRVAASTAAAIMLGGALACQWKGEAMVRAFTADPAVTAVGAGYLQFRARLGPAGTIGGASDGIPATKAGS